MVAPKGANCGIEDSSVKRQVRCTDLCMGGTTVPALIATVEEFFALVDEGTGPQYALEKQPRIIADAILL